MHALDFDLVAGRVEVLAKHAAPVVELDDASIQVYRAIDFVVRVMDPRLLIKKSPAKSPSVWLNQSEPRGGQEFRRFHESWMAIGHCSTCQL